MNVHPQTDLRRGLACWGFSRGSGFSGKGLQLIPRSKPIQAPLLRVLLASSKVPKSHRLAVARFVVVTWKSTFGVALPEPKQEHLDEFVRVRSLMESARLN